eukprot:2633656-Rhodomonas_salina.1
MQDESGRRSPHGGFDAEHGAVEPRPGQPPPPVRAQPHRSACASEPQASVCERARKALETREGGREKGEKEKETRQGKVIKDKERKKTRRGKTEPAGPGEEGQRHEVMPEADEGEDDPDAPPLGLAAAEGNVHVAEDPEVEGGVPLAPEAREGVVHVDASVHVLGHVDPVHHRPQPEEAPDRHELHVPAAQAACVSAFALFLAWLAWCCVCQSSSA